jgi:tetratricopeptide (TPR) repeat protein
MIAGFAGWQAHTPVTVIAPFQMPKSELPFSAEIVADALQDALTSIHDEITRENSDLRLKPAEMDLPVLRDLNSPKFSTAQDATRFTVEVKGVSYERIVSAARALWRSEKIISGDVVLNGNDKDFILVARMPGGGPWQSVLRPATADGLKRASRDLAEKILEAQDPTLAGAALLKDGRIEQAVAALDRAQSEKPTNTKIMNLCMAYEASHRYAKAVECYGRVQKMGPNSDELSERLAHAQYLSGGKGREDAINAFRKLAEKGYSHALLELGKALEDTGHHEDALKAYKDFVAKPAHPGENRTHDLAIAYVNLGAAFASQKDHQAAFNQYQEALKYAPGDVLVLVNLAVETAAKGDLEDGIAQLQGVIDGNENLDSIPFAHFQLGKLLQEKHDWQGAAEQFREATELRPSYDEARRNLAFSLAHEGLPAYAFSEYTKVAKLSPNEPDRRHSQVLAYQWLGNVLREHGNYSGAASAYREAIKLKHDYRAAHCELGFILERQGHLDEAIQEYRAAVNANPTELDDRDTLQVARVRLEDALVSQGQARRAETIAELRRLMELDLKDLECHFCLAKALLDQHKFVEAGSEYESLIRLEPQSAAAHHGLARTLHKQGLVDQAVVEFRRAADFAANNPAYHSDLAHELDLQHSRLEAAAERGIVAKLSLDPIVPRDGLGQGTHQRCQDAR